MSLRALSHQLEYLQEQIHRRIEHVRLFFLGFSLEIDGMLTCVQLEDQMEASIQNSRDRAGNVIRNADAEIARTRAILAAIDDLENELAKIGHIRDIVKSFRARIESYDHRLDQAARRR
jgi:hypothetical protein